MLSLESLNPPQREAVLHESGPLVVFAGAGSGKTRVITYRIANLITLGTPAHRVLAVTFTNKAAGEMRERLGGLLGWGNVSRRLWVGTFHATCARLLREYAEPMGVRRDFVIYDDADQRAMVTRVLRDLGLDDKRYGPKQVAGRINRAKQEAIGHDTFDPDNPFDEIVQRVYVEYEKRMALSGALDFGDLIFRPVAALEADAALRGEIAGRFSHVLVDEFQDTNHVQYRLLRAVAAKHRNLCVVGDDDQSIYRWRGADRRFILDFRNEFPDATVIKLEQNYRSTQRILRVANAIIERNHDREPKRLWTENEDGRKIVVVRCEDERDEARMIVRAVRELHGDGTALRDIAIFYRTHAQSRVLEEALRASNVSYRVIGGMRFYERAEIKDVLAYLRVVHNPDDDVSILRIINTPARGIGKSTIDKILDDAAVGGVGVWKALLRAEDNDALGVATRKKLAEFVAMIEKLRTLVAAGDGVYEVAAQTLHATGYLDMLRDENSAESDARLQNLEELLGSMEEFEKEAESPTLASYLELVTLATDEDKAVADDRLTLMTVHAAKGLEFPVVMVTGLEERMFPFRGTDPGTDPEELEEERRLAYVAFTRARERLVLSWAGVRRIFGDAKVGQPSRFILELPSDDVEHVGVASPRPPPSRGYRPDPYDSGPAKPARGERESYVDTSEGSDLEALRLGMRVRHAKFGIGQVKAITEGLPPRVTVLFPGWGMKQVVASYLEPC